jgi:deoxycytidylate deaminase
MNPPDVVVAAAVAEACKSPCLSKRGAVLFHNGNGISGRPFCAAHNRKPQGFSCGGSAQCKATCRDEAVHAEQSTLLQAGGSARATDLVHVKVVDGALVASGPPSCVQCSKLILTAGVRGVWLFHEGGWHRYPAHEFHQRSLENAR